VVKNQQFNPGNFRQQDGYKSFVPAKIARDYRWADSEIDGLLEEANRYLGELNAYSRLVPDVDFFIGMHIFKEAITSSRIEGTKTGLDEALLPEDEINPERRDDWAEVRNYIRAMNYSIKELERLPLSVRLLKGAHKTLLSSVRGEHKNPGEIRNSQNWIGGSSLKDAIFIPPPAHEVSMLLSDLEHFLHGKSIKLPRLIRIAVGHYQFETIHPFLDGNGRIDRLMITLFLVSEGILRKPTLYLSDFFEKNKGSYYDSLTAVRLSGDLDQWLRFFLVGVATTAQAGAETFESIVALRQRAESGIMTLGKRSQKGRDLLIKLFSQPIINAKQVSEWLDVTPPSANSLVASFQDLGILQEITGYKRNRLFEFTEYVKLFEK
jgi:Fic family protein